MFILVIPGPASAVGSAAFEFHCADSAGRMQSRTRQ